MAKRRTSRRPNDRSQRFHDVIKKRRMLLEQLESRQLLALSPMGDHSHEGEILLALPIQQSLMNSGGYLSEPSNGAPLTVADEFLRDNASSLGLTSQSFDDYLVSSVVESKHVGTTHVYLQQTYNNLGVANANVNVNVAENGQVISVGSSFLSGLHTPNPPLIPVPVLSAPEAVTALAGEFGWTLSSSPVVVSSQNDIARRSVITSSGISLDNIAAELQYIPQGQGVELAWRLNVRTVDGQHWYDASVSAVDGDLLNLADWVAHASYQVYPLPVESPDDGVRSTVVDPHNLVASPFGWHDTNGVSGAESTLTIGNNVWAAEGRDSGNIGVSPDGGVGLDFSFPLNLTQSPNQYTAAATTNLFYWNNLAHDVHYQYGFDESSGNFQLNNYGNGGLESDDVLALSQFGADVCPPLFGSCRNNANFGTPPDGFAPIMRMYETTSATPNRDTDLDDVVIVHEYGHGVSNRLTGGPANSNALQAVQSRGMGEGWGDFWGLMFTQKPTDGQFDAYPVGDWSFNLPQGIRSFPYSFNLSINPLTYNDGNARFPVGSPHAEGEIWASALWDLNWLLINKHGYDPDLYNGTGGNNIALQLVMDGLKLQPANPFILGCPRRDPRCGHGIDWRCESRLYLDGLCQTRDGLQRQ